ncbi:HNH endonuclease signature motif containing protein [Clostridium sp.]|uniref:HNH endonuclease signature motif containing protein n=1 Tax=Clostridium sp. TaxID=1506 RepID=UPI001B5053EF|nr:HNH endonuclease signature motif containing protein [Clostridium sp.]MBP3917449.1 HNH endonuclease [Clostridium sp.]
MGRPKGSKDKKPQHKWTNEEKEYLVSIVKGSTYKEITKQMNDKFEYNFSEEQIKGMMYRNKLTTGTGGYFKKGFTPWNKGLKGYMGANKTSFKKGTIPPNQVSIGTESIAKGGYIKVKVGEPNKWKLKQRYIYEQHYGEIPKGHNVIFADRNIQNFDINNLILVSKAEMLILNNNKLIFEDEELTKVGVNIAKVIDKTKKRSK